MAQSFKSNHNSFYSCKYHVVWCPKYRRKVLTGDIAERLKSIVHEVAAELESEVLELEVMSDHVHILCEVPPHQGIAKFVRICKGRSSRVLREEFPALKTRLPTLWTHSTFISTVGGAPLSLVKQYIQNQQRSEPRPKKSEPRPKKSEPRPKKSEPRPKKSEPRPKKSEPRPKKNA